MPVGPDGATDAKALAAAVDDRTFAVAVQSPNFFGVVEDWSVGSAAAQGEGRALGRRRRRGRLARAPRPSGRGGRRHRLRRGAVARRADAQRRAAARLSRLPHGAPAPDPRAPRRPDEGRRGPARLLPDALDPRAAHPPREGDLQHLHEPGPDGAGLQHPHVAARQAGPARGGPADPRQGRVPEGRIARLPGYRIPYPGPTFNEFVVEAPGAAAPLLARLAGRKILAGVPLSRYDAKDRPPRFSSRRRR